MKFALAMLLCVLALDRTPVAAQPTAPAPQQLPRFQAASQPAPSVLALGEPWTVDITSREETRQFYRALYFASEGISLGWTGSISPGVAGTTSTAFQEAVRVRVNTFRALAGVPADVSFNATYSAKAQQAALMMSSNNSLSHNPPSSWTNYTAAGDEAAGASNLALGSAGPDAITGYIGDSGSNNAVVGHRRWILYPQTRIMGTGDVPGDDTHYAANALWVQDANLFGPRPATRDAYVAWPNRGYVPHTLVFPRWSFSHPNASFASTTVTMTSGGSAIPVTVESRTNGSGAPEATIVWIYNNLSTDEATPHPRPSADKTYTVNVNGVVINGTSRNFTYNVIVFDPDVAGGDFTPTTVSGSGTPATGVANNYTVAKPAFTGAFQWRSLQLSAFSTTYGAEGDLQNVVPAISAGYNARVTSPVAAGNGAYHLAHPDGADQHLTLPETFFLAAGGAGALSFQSRLGYAAAGQVARAQISTDDGVSWTDLYTQAGSGAAGENSYTARSADLAAYAGQTFHIRFAYTFSTGSFYNQTTATVGWLIDSIALTGVQRAVVGANTTVATSGAFSFTPPAVGAYGLQARGLLFTAYPIGWGAVLAVTAGSASPPTITSHPATQAATAGGAVTFSVSASGAATLSYQWRLDGADIPGATEATYTVPSVQAFHSGSYTVAVTSGGVSTISNAATLSVGAAPTSTARLLNLSTRALSQTGSNALIPGFVLQGSGTRELLVRAVGPTLGNAPFNLPGVLADPQIILRKSTTPPPDITIATNDDWSSAPNAAAILAAADTVGAFDLNNPSKDAALLVNLTQGAYTAVTSGASNGTGLAIVELYATNNTGPALINISNRGFVSTGSNIMIPGFVVSNEGSRTFLIRVVGPTLAGVPFNITGTLADPVLTIFTRLPGDNFDTAILTNDDWGVGSNPTLTAATAVTVGAFELAVGSKDAAFVVTLPPGAYTVTATGKDGATGVAIVEIYLVP